MIEYKKATLVLFRAAGLYLAHSKIPVELRQSAQFYLLHLVFGVGLQLIGNAAGCSKQNVSARIKKLEKKAEQDLALQAELERLEAQVLGEGV